MGAAQGDNLLAQVGTGAAQEDNLRDRSCSVKIKKKKKGGGGGGISVDFFSRNGRCGLGEGNNNNGGGGGDMLLDLLDRNK